MGVSQAFRELAILGKPPKRTLYDRELVNTSSRCEKYELAPRANARRLRREADAGPRPTCNSATAAPSASMKSIHLSWRSP